MANILICDDSAFTRRMIKDVLNDQGHTFLDVADGEALLSIIQREKFDCILLDLRMPKKDGFEVLEEMKNLIHKPPVIVISSEEESESSKKCIELGAFAFIRKPPEKTVLQNTISLAIQALAKV